MRTCKECGAEKPIEEYPLVNGYRRHKCRTCVARYNLAYQRKYRKKIYQESKARAIDQVFGQYGEGD